MFSRHESPLLAPWRAHTIDRGRAWLWARQGCACGVAPCPARCSRDPGAGELHLQGGALHVPERRRCVSSNVVHRRLTYHTYRLSSIVPYLMASHMVYVTVLQPTSTAAQPDGFVLATVFYILELVDRIVTVPNPKARASNHLSDASLGCAARYSQIAKSYCVLAGAWLLSALLLGPLASSRRLAVIAACSRRRPIHSIQLRPVTRLPLS